jgi:hypothetical protein
MRERLRDRRVGKMVLEVSELHDPREPSGRPWCIRDPAHVDLVGFAWSVRQKLQGLQFGTNEDTPS